MRLGMGLGLGNLLSGQPLTGFPNDFSFNFDGSNDYLEIADNSGLQLTTLTISGWINFSSSESGYIITKFDASTTGGYAVEISSGNTLRFYVAGLSARSSDAVFTADEWQHFAVTVDGSGNLAFYRNGVACGTNTITMTTNNVPLLIGNRTGGTNASHFFNGLIDEVAIWDTALDASTIAKLGSKPVDVTKYSASNLKLWLRAGDKAEPESTTSIARQDFYTDFDGTNDYIDIDSTGISLNDFSISGWFYHIDSTAEFQAIIALVDTGNDYQEGVVIQFYNNYFDAEGASVDGHLPKVSANTVGSGILQNSWNHFAYTVDRDGGSGGVKLYLNGALATTDTAVDNATNGNNIYIGAGYYSSVIRRFYKGYISNIAIHQTTLDAQTIKQFAKSRFTPMRDNRFSVVDFDGSDDYVNVSDNSVLDFGTGDFTITSWFNQTTAQSAVVAKGSFGGEGDFLIYDLGDGGSGAGKMIFRNDDNTGQNQFDFTSSTFNNAGWTHIAVTRSGQTITTYANGVQHATGSIEANYNFSNAHNVSIGAREDGTQRYFGGAISSVSFYNTAKSADEIYALYSKGITYNESSESGLVGLWRMGDDTSKAYPTIADSSSNSNDGTITNGASDDIVQQMVAGYDLGAFESSSEELGAERVSEPSFASSTGWTLGTGWSISSNILSSDGSQSAVSNAGASITTSAGLYKVIITVDSISSGTIRPNLQSWGSYISTTGTHTQFFTLTGNNNLIIQASVDFVGSISFASVKEVLQSEVSDTYPAIIDVNEPVLGSELITNGSFDTDSDWTKGVGSTIQNGRLEIDGTQTGTERTFQGSVVSDNTKLYKYSITISGYSSGNIYLTMGGFNSGNITANGTYSFYSVPSSGLGQINIYYNATFVGNVDEISIREVLGNVGTMTNQDSADLVYSSVLPDQSFLTGVNSAYNFIDLDGSNEYVDVGNSADVNFGTSNFSISTWINTSDADGAIYSSYNASHPYVHVRLVSGKVYLYLSNSSSNGEESWASTTTVNDNSWHYIAVSVNKSSGVSMYIDATLETLSATGTIGNVANDLGSSKTYNIGRHPSGATYLAGQISSVSVYNTAKSAEEIYAIYTAGRHSNLLDSYSDNLLGYWAMSALDAKTGLSDVGDGTIYDRSGNSNHGTATNTESADLKSSPNAEPNGYAKGDTNRSTTTP